MVEVFLTPHAVAVNCIGEMSQEIDWSGLENNWKQWQESVASYAKTFSHNIEENIKRASLVMAVGLVISGGALIEWTLSQLKDQYAIFSTTSSESCRNWIGLYNNASNTEPISRQIIVTDANGNILAQDENLIGPGLQIDFSSACTPDGLPLPATVHTRTVISSPYGQAPSNQVENTR